MTPYKPLVTSLAIIILAVCLIGAALPSDSEMWKMWKEEEEMIAPNWTIDENPQSTYHIYVEGNAGYIENADTGRIILIFTNDFPEVEIRITQDLIKSVESDDKILRIILK